MPLPGAVVGIQIDPRNGSRRYVRCPQPADDRSGGTQCGSRSQLDGGAAIVGSTRRHHDQFTESVKELLESLLPVRFPVVRKAYRKRRDSGRRGNTLSVSQPFGRVNRDLSGLRYLRPGLDADCNVELGADSKLTRTQGHQP